MSGPLTVRNSQILSLFDAMLHDSSIPLRALEDVGRGITVAARCLLIINGHKRERHAEPAEASMQRALVYSDRLLELAAIEEDLADAWDARSGGRLADGEFATALATAVERIGEWADSPENL